MLHIIKRANDSTVFSIDTVFDALPLENHLEILKLIVKLNGSSLIDNSSAFTHETPIADIRMRHTFWGSASLINLPTGLKGLALAAFAMQDLKPFSCYEFCIGANVFPKFIHLAEDSDLIALVAPNLQLSLVSAQMKKYRVLIEGEEGEIFC